MKIRTRMLLFIAVPILMAILLIAGSSYVYSSRMVEGLSKSEMLETAKKYGSNLETFIAKQIANVDMLSDSITMSDLSDKELYNELIYVTDKNSEILAPLQDFQISASLTEASCLYLMTMTPQPETGTKIP